MERSTQRLALRMEWSTQRLALRMERSTEAASEDGVVQRLALRMERSTVAGSEDGERKTHKARHMFSSRQGQRQADALLSNPRQEEGLQDLDGSSVRPVQTFDL